MVPNSPQPLPNTVEAIVPQSLDPLAKITTCFRQLGSNSEENISSLTALLEEFQEDLRLVALIAAAIGLEERRQQIEEVLLKQRSRMEQLSIATMSREERITVLKQEVNELLAEQGKTKRYFV